VPLPRPEESLPHAPDSSAARGGLFSNNRHSLAVVKKAGIQLSKRRYARQTIGLAVLKTRTSKPRPDTSTVGTIGVIQKMLKFPTARCAACRRSKFSNRTIHADRSVHGRGLHRAAGRDARDEELVPCSATLPDSFRSCCRIFRSPARDGDGGPEHHGPQRSDVLRRIDDAPGHRRRQAVLEERDTPSGCEAHDAPHEGDGSRRARRQDSRRHPARVEKNSASSPAPATARHSGRTREVDPQQAETNELRAKIDEPRFEEARRLRTANSTGSRKFRRPVPSTASSVRISTGSFNCRGPSRDDLIELNARGRS